MEAPASAVPWWDAPYPERFDATQLAAKPSFVRVDGNRFVDESGQPRVFQGVSIADPYGPQMTDYLARKGASWVAWCFHPDWPPPS